MKKKLQGVLGGLLLFGATMFVAVPAVIVEAGYNQEGGASAVVQTCDAAVADSMPGDAEGFAIYAPEKPWAH